MRRIAPILLVLLLVFNVVGYRMLSHFVEQKQDRQLVQKIDRQHFNESDLFELTVDIDLPYQADWQEFERFDGEIEIDGIHYKYVKRRIYQGKLVLLCLPNEGKTQIQTARDEFFRLMNDLNHSSESGTTNGASMSKSLFSDYLKDNAVWKLPALETINSLYHSASANHYNFSFQQILTQPPDSLS